MFKSIASPVTLPVKSRKNLKYRTLEQESQPVVDADDNGVPGEIFPPLCYVRLSNVPTCAWQLPDEPNCTYCAAMRFRREPPGFCCASGKVAIDVPKMHPRLWNLFVNDVSPIGQEFRRRCRSYNNTMAFTSIGYECDNKMANAEVGVYTVRIQGAISHYIKNLIPRDGFARHAQLYFYGTETEIDNRVAQAEDLEKPIIELLLEILQVNPYHNFFVQARELPCIASYTIVLRGDPILDKNVYNLPVVDHVAAIWSEDGSDVQARSRDVRVYLKKGGSAQINYYYGCYDPLCYLLLHPYGDPGWRMGLKKRERPNNFSLEAGRVPHALQNTVAATSTSNLLGSEHSN